MSNQEQDFICFLLSLLPRMGRLARGSEGVKSYSAVEGPGPEFWFHLAAYDRSKSEIWPPLHSRTGKPCLSLLPATVPGHLCSHGSNSKKRNMKLLNGIFSARQQSKIKQNTLVTSVLWGLPVPHQGRLPRAAASWGRAHLQACECAHHSAVLLTSYLLSLIKRSLLYVWMPCDSTVEVAALGMNLHWLFL